MEMNAEFLFQVGAVVASLAGAWGLVRAQVNTLKSTQEEMKNYIDELNRELDKAENNVSVMKSQIKILADILSPANLASENRRKGETARRLQSLEEAIVVLQHMHNGKHPPVDYNEPKKTKSSE
jgi:polyhydroxyalkanoate synthesis regulator phasin|tara:strand:+ start:97 stop:468 length:372 start_codon:yes stop_codon:yes gene_type:complete